jgi:hypothetical protein
MKNILLNRLHYEFIITNDTKPNISICYVISKYSFFPRGYSKKMAGCIKSYNKRGEQTFNTKYTGK